MPQHATNTSFKKGDGRTRGIKKKGDRSWYKVKMEEVIRSIIDEEPFRDNLRELLLNAKDPALLRIALEYGIGKPTQQVVIREPEKELSLAELFKGITKQEAQVLIRIYERLAVLQGNQRVPVEGIVIERKALPSRKRKKETTDEKESGGSSGGRAGDS